MKTKQISLTIAAAITLGLAGCSRNEPATSGAEDASKAAVSAADAAAKITDAANAGAGKAAEAAKAEAAKAADAAKAEVAKVADNTQAQGLIDKAKSLIAEGKLSDASSVLQQLTGQTLSGDQTKLVATLKEQIQKALTANAAENAAGNVGNLLKK